MSAGRRFAKTREADIAASLRQEIPELAQIAADELQRATASELRRSHAAAVEERPPTPDELDASAAVSAGLARSGVPMEAANRWRRLMVRRVFEEDAAGGVEYLYRLWDWADTVAAGTAAVYRQLELDVEARDDDQRARFVRGLLDGSLSTAEAQSRAAAYGLLPSTRYLTLRGRAAAGTDGARLRRELELSGSGGEGGALVALVDGDLWGVVSRRPQLGPAQGLVALGAAAELGGLPASFDLATRALETAIAFGVEGVVSIDELSLRPVILAEEHVGEWLMRRYLEPLRELGEYGATLEHTVNEYLASGMRVDASAKTLIVHPNTLRHRLDRFQQLTGADLRKTQDVVEVWWALERRRVSPG